MSNAEREPSRGTGSATALGVLGSGSPDAEAAEALAARLADEMTERWRHGERPVTEEFLAREPLLRACPGAVIELLYEELCLRDEFGEQVSRADLLRRFPQCGDGIEMLLECHRLLEPRGPAPDIGGVIAGFRLVAELGHGAHGRVCLATDPHLADRPVVLKLIPRHAHEHLSLARLQHTYIVPLYSVADDPEKGVSALCMPYFGGTTLARILDALRGRPVEQRTGQDILEVLEQARQIDPLGASVRGPAWQFYATASYVRAVCWIGACLADALEYAHQRGLVHLDLKPSNVLIAADGQPMLLDFHLARPPLAAGGTPPDWLGGTAGYMSPEQELALAAVREARPVPAPVDGRSDVYSLGILLDEALAGEVPSHPAPARLDRLSAVAGPGLAAVIARCLANDPAGRYPSAAALGGDLRRHLADLPLRGVANRSWAERWGKWRRRRPHALAIIGLAAALAAALTGTAALALVDAGRRTQEARAALAEGKNHLEKRQYEESIDAFTRGLASAHAPFGPSDLRRELMRERSHAERARMAAELHTLADQMRFLYAADVPHTASAHALEARCRAVWDKRDLIRSELGRDGLEQIGRGPDEDLLDLAILWSDLHTRLAPQGNADAARHEAIAVLDEAKTAFGPSAVLERERGAHAARLAGSGTRSETDADQATPPRTAWEYYALGRALLGEGRLEGAAARFERAVELDPAGLWPNFYQGVCAYRRGHYEDAVLAFTACVGAAPQRSGCFYNRALAYAALGRPDRALRDYDRALELDPGLGAAALNRAILHYRANRLAPARADLERALANGADPAAVHYNLGLVHLAEHDGAAATREIEAALEHNPSHREAAALRDRLLREP